MRMPTDESERYAELTVEDDVARICSGLSVVQTQYFFLWIKIGRFQQVELGGEFTGDVGTRLRILDTTKIAVSSQRKH